MRRLIRTVLSIWIAVYSNVLVAEETPATELPLLIYSGTSKLAPVQSLIAKTVEAIAQSIAPRKVEHHNVSISELLKIAKEQKADVLIAGNGFTARRNFHNYRDVGSALTKDQKDVNHANGSTVLVAKKRDDLQTLDDLRGKTLLANDPEGFQGIILLLHELQKRGHNPDNFFSKIRYIGNDYIPYLPLLKEEKIDALVLPSCQLEALKLAGIDTSYLKVLEPTNQNYISCQVSTELYPNWSLMVASHLSFDTQHAIFRGVSQLSREKDGIAWGYAADTSRVHAMYKDLKRGPYEYLRYWTVKRVWEEYRLLVLLVVVAILGFLWHYMRTRVLVKRRTQALQRSLATQEELLHKNQALAKSLQEVESTAAVSHFSSLVAHELSQPLSGVIMYATTLQQLLQNAGENEPKLQAIVEKILKRAIKSAEIVQEVREFAQGKRKERTELHLTDLVQDWAQDYLSTEKIATSTLVFQKKSDDITLVANPFDLHLIVVNLLRNCVAALEKTKRPKILLSLSREGNQVILCVEDNGAGVSPEKMEYLGKPIQSLKTDGLGLGLTIVKYIVEDYRGKIRFYSSRLGGLGVKITLPATA